MSIILDALKKSEAERQQSGAPGLYETRMAPHRRRLPPWLGIICALLLINAIGLAWVLLRDHAGVTPAPAAAVPAPAQPMTTSPGPAPQPAVAAPGTAATTPAGARPDADASPAPAARNTVDTDTETDADDAPAIAPAGATTPAATTAAAPETGGAHVHRITPEQALPSGPPPPLNLPSYQDAAASGGLPTNLAINLHSWSKDPSQRYILLNMVRLKEGDTSPQGVKVESITQDGAILSWQGREFTLQR